MTKETFAELKQIQSDLAGVIDKATEPLLTRELGGIETRLGEALQSVTAEQIESQAVGQQAGKDAVVTAHELQASEAQHLAHIAALNGKLKHEQAVRRTLFNYSGVGDIA
jgi:hypothetical protein